MTEFNTPITEDQRAFLADNKAELSKTDGGKAIWQNRVKKASEAYNELKGIHGAHVVETLVPKTSEDEDADVSTFTDWPTFRDNFILDWIGSRTVVTEKEADMIFDRTAEEALQVIEQGEQNAADTESDGPPFTTQTPQEMAQENLRNTLAEQTPPVATKRRGRPPGSGKKSTAAVTKVTKSKKPRKVAAKKKGGSASAKAQAIIEKYAARDWSRKDIIQKLQSQLDMGAAYAATLYQKFA